MERDATVLSVAQYPAGTVGEDKVQCQVNYVIHAGEWQHDQRRIDVSGVHR